MPTFCRHNRFIDRCPICSKTLPGAAAVSGRSPPSATPPRGSAPRRATRTGGPRGERVRVQRERRAQDDGYRCALLRGVRASADAARLAEEIAFASGRLRALATAPWGLYAEVRAVAERDLQQATWMCFLICYLSPLDCPPPAEEPLVSRREPRGAEDPFAPIRLVLRGGPQTLAALEQIPLGPRTSHDPARGADTLIAYRRWVERAHRAGDAFAGEPGWSPMRRFERLFERLALPGFGRMGRYELLVTLGRLGLYELRADSLHLLGARAPTSQDLTTLGAKRLFAIGDPLHLERRAAALAEAIDVPLETLDVALANWASAHRATLGIEADTSDRGALARARDALGL
jgi:Alpha-glutamyl/putrescinyl thymine pyrophosphorylase clade 3